MEPYKPDSLAEEPIQAPVPADFKLCSTVETACNTKEFQEEMINHESI
jgi:hypothetical protein